MNSRLFGFLMMAVLACPLGITTARGDNTEVAAATDADAAVAEASEPIPKSDMAQKMSNNVCEITGVVSKIENVERSPWMDGTPSALSMYETDISVRVDDRRPHYKTATPDSLCNRKARGEMVIYKLCSDTPVKAGNRIHATEGMQTGSARARGCLFDLVIIPPAEQKSGKKT